jgi:hypothetical protein
MKGLKLNYLVRDVASAKSCINLENARFYLNFEIRHKLTKFRLKCAGEHSCVTVSVFELVKFSCKFLTGWSMILGDLPPKMSDFSYSTIRNPNWN